MLHLKAKLELSGSPGILCKKGEDGYNREMGHRTIIATEVAISGYSLTATKGNSGYIPHVRSSCNLEEATSIL